MRTLQNGIFKIAVVLALSFVLFGCKEWKESKTYPSPDGKFVIVASVELQGANDPEPWWQHISIYRAGEEKKNEKGNLFVYSSDTPPIVSWKGPKNLEIQMDGVEYSFTGPSNSRVSREVTLTAIINKPEQGNDD